MVSRCALQQPVIVLLREFYGGGVWPGGAGVSPLRAFVLEAAGHYPQGGDGVHARVVPAAVPVSGTAQCVLLNGVIFLGSLHLVRQVLLPNLPAMAAVLVDTSHPCGGGGGGRQHAARGLAQLTEWWCARSDVERAVLFATACATVMFDVGGRRGSGARAFSGVGCTRAVGRT